jgi:hypothetical protein
LSQQHDADDRLERAWLPLVNAMRTGEKHWARYFIDDIPIPISQRLISTSDHQLFIQDDDWRNHIAKVVLDFVPQKAVRFASYPPCSQNTAPSDFFSSAP